HQWNDKIARQFANILSRRRDRRDNGRSAMSKNRNILRIAALAFVSAGCYDRTLSGENAVYTFQLWVPVVTGLGFLGLAALGVLWARRGRRLNGTMISVGAIVLLSIVLPGAIRDRVIIGPDRFFWDTGIWVSPVRHDVQFSEVVSAYIESEVS